MSFSSDLRTAFSGSYRALHRLMVLLIVLFLVINISDAISSMSGSRTMHSLAEWLSIPGSLSRFVGRFWTLLTYMFTHLDILHLLSNLLILYFIGRMFTDFFGSSRFLGVFVLGGLSGGLLFLIVASLVPQLRDSYLLGASGGISALLVATATYRPNVQVMVFGVWSVALKYIALVVVVLFSLIDLATNTGGKVAHLGGALLGFAYGWQFRSGRKPLEGFMRLFQKAEGRHLRVEHRRAMNDEEYAENRAQRRKRIDEILDKISRSGYDSLTPEEKKYLQHNHDKT